MARIVTRRDHALTRAAARRMADAFAADLGRRHGLASHWRNDDLAFARPGISGTLRVRDDHVEVDVTLGFVASMLKATLEREIARELDRVLGAAAGGVAPPPTA